MTRHMKIRTSTSIGILLLLLLMGVHSECLHCAEQTTEAEHAHHDFCGWVLKASAPEQRILQEQEKPASPVKLIWEETPADDQPTFYGMCHSPAHFVQITRTFLSEFLLI
ncbi:MAG TPA: hypothetical protein ENN17_08140 [bacterium]|nr:hypothetical protein [bacterium]